MLNIYIKRSREIYIFNLIGYYFIKQDLVFLRTFIHIIGILKESYHLNSNYNKSFILLIAK